VTTRSDRAVKNYVSALLFAAVTLATGFVATPLLLRWLGEQRFGALRAMTDWYGYLGLLELGIGGALLPLLSRALGRTDEGVVRRTLASGLRAYVGVTMAMLTSGIGLAITMTWLVPVRGSDADDLQRASLLGLVGILLVLLTPFRALIDARQMGYRINVLLLLQCLLTTGLSLALARAGTGIAGQSAAVLVGALPLAMYLAWDGVRRYPGILRSAILDPPDAEAWRDLWTLNRPTLIVNVCGRVSFLTDTILVALVSTPAMVVPLIITQRLALVAQGQLQGLGNASWAGLADMHARGERESFARRVVELTTLVVILAMATLGPIAAYNHHFVARWVGGNYYGGDLFTIVAALNALLMSLFSLWGWCFTCTGQVRQLVPQMIALAGLNLTLSIVLTRSLGIVGPLLGTLIAFVLAGWYVPFLLHRTLFVPLSELLRGVMRPLALGVPWGAALWWFARAHEPPGWIGLAGEMAAAGALSLALSWLFVVGRTERIIWVQRARAFGIRRPTA
jgi:O-antigen/teichoic acid export membrane protein